MNAQKPPTGWLDIRVRAIDLIVDVMVESICGAEATARRIRHRLTRSKR